MRSSKLRALPAKGVSLDDDVAERWLLTSARTPAYVELGPSRRNRCKPPWHTPRFGQDGYQVLLRTPLPTSDVGATQPVSAGGSDHAPVAGLVRLLADAFPNPQGAATFLPLRQNITILREVAARLRSAGGGFPVPQFLEPLTFPLRVPAELGTVEFTRRLCLEVGARALLDAGTMVVAARNGRETIDSWLNELDPGTVGVLRIGAVLQRNGCWIRDREGEIDRDCWDVLEAAAAHL